MPLHVEIHRLSRTIVVVARGEITAEDVDRCAREIVDGNVRHFAKIIDVSTSTSEVTADQIGHIASWLRAGEVTRGAVAFVVDPEREELAQNFADATQSDRPVKLFRSIHEARRWIAEVSNGFAD
ncbi:STAS/SEC14 domain-containing protein [Reyranella massiliensis]|uniref:STAS/SEC14 domain-containing protein n=1 Tax=Reyranella massiliensis TaxID=445220 RepID=UPI0002E831D6|nr:STAS/SEC14 domain-containing protein [Reyranella massiliensis]